MITYIKKGFYATMTGAAWLPCIIFISFAVAVMGYGLFGIFRFIFNMIAWGLT